MTESRPRRMGARHHTGTARADRARPGDASQADRLRRPARSSSSSRFLAFGPLKGTLENKFVDPGLGRAEGDRRARGQVRRAQRRHAAGRDATRPTASGSTRRAAQGRDRRRRSPRPARPSRDRRQRPVRRRQPAVLDDRSAHRLRRGAVLQGRVRARRARRSWPSRTRCRPTLGQGRHPAEFTGDADQAPPEQGASELHRHPVALIVLLIVFRTLVAAGVPIVFALLSVRHGVRPAVPAREPDRLQHDHADPRLDDRHRRRHRLHALHRHALQTGAA